ncbi:MAG: VOC family protein [Bacteroidetes bacterium]|nr:VOC family protein [Bacteroidota bacterium]
MNTVGYFEIQSSNPQREINFYHKVFGWDFVLEPQAPNEYYRIETRNMHGGLLKRLTDLPPQGSGTNAFTCSIRVSDYDQMAEKIIANGGKIVLAKFPIPYRCWQGYFVDEDNNTFGIFQVDRKAK